MGSASTSSILQEAAAGRAYIQPWTVEQYQEAIKSGLIEERTDFELLDGFIVRKDRAKAGEDPMTIGDRHRIVVTRLAHLSPQFEPRGCFLQSQQPISIPPLHAPEPDTSIIRGMLDDYQEAPPQAADVTCVIEVADSSLVRDLGTKLKLYARAGIRQYVVVDLVNDFVLDHRQPAGDQYGQVTPLRSGDMIEVSTAGQPVTIAVDRLLPR